MSETKAPTPEQIAEWRQYAENEHRWLHRVLDWLEASQKRAEEAERLLKVLEEEAIRDPIVLWSGDGKFPEKGLRGLSVKEGLAEKVAQWPSLKSETKS